MGIGTSPSTPAEKLEAGLRVLGDLLMQRADIDHKIESMQRTLFRLREDARLLAASAAVSAKKEIDSEG